METITVSMLENELLKSFWEFATTVRRTHSLADRESRRIRGAWLTPTLAVQRVHGWGLRSVRLLCVSAPTEAQQERLRFFFEKDKRNLEGRLVHSKDPLDTEPRVLVKIPYESGLDSWVQHERQVLTDLAGLEGLPKLHQPLYFEDISVHAATYEYCDALSLQQKLEEGVLVQKEDVHHMGAFMLKTLSRAHAIGWLHTDLQPKDILLGGVAPNTQTANAEEELRIGIGGAALADDVPALSVERSGPRCSLLCGWSRAVPCDEAATCTGPAAMVGGLVDFVQGLPVSTTAEAGDDSVQNDDHATTAADLATTSIDSAASGEDAGTEDATTPPEGEQDAGTEDPTVNSNTSGRELAAPSLYAAPEQLVGLFAGMPYALAATDIYRVAAIILMATCAHGPLGVQGRPVGRSAASDVDALRRLCKQAILKRAEFGGREGASAALALPSTEERKAFAERLERLLNGRVSLRGWSIPELLPWMQCSLARETNVRYQTAADALEALDEGWSAFEEALLNDLQVSEATETLKTSLSSTVSPSPNLDGSVDRDRKVGGRVQRLVFEPPPELLEMTIL